MSQSLDCDSHNIIYLVTCTFCKWQYVGESGRKHKDRSPEHLRDIDNAPSEDKPLKPIQLHFQQKNHSKDNFSIQVIEKCLKETTAYRKIRETFWQDLIKPQINRQHNKF